VNLRRLRWALAIIAITIEIAAFVVWRVWLRSKAGDRR
jgi:hypothetical protein